MSYVKISTVQLTTAYVQYILYMEYEITVGRLTLLLLTCTNPKLSEQTYVCHCSILYYSLTSFYKCSNKFYYNTTICLEHIILYTVANVL